MADADRRPLSRRVRLLLWLLFAVAAALVLLDLAVAKHPHFAWESWPGFAAAFGFAASALAVLLARLILRPLAGRREDFYDR